MTFRIKCTLGIQVEALQLELAEAKDKIEELTLDFEILKAEFDKVGSSSGESEENNVVSSYQMKQLEEQNLRLRDTLVRFVEYDDLGFSIDSGFTWQSRCDSFFFPFYAQNA